MAMSMSYDEDLTDNPFFKTLRAEYIDIFYKAILEGCVLCVPRTGSLPNYSITLDDILGHVLLPSDEMPESHFHTLSGKEVKISNRIVVVEWDPECQLSIQILFEETYYTEDMLKYKVVCLEHPLEPKAEGAVDGVLAIGTLRDCIDFINNESGNKTLTDSFDRSISSFLRNREAIENASFQTVKDLTLGLYQKCLFEALGDRQLKNKCMTNPHNMKTLKLAVETYVHHRIYKNIFKCICATTAENDANLSKIIRNCVDLQLKDLEIQAEFHDLIPKAKAELMKLGGYGTVMGKLSCLRKMFAVMAKDPESGGLLAADDLLPIIIFILLKVNVNNWFAHLQYLKHFRFSCHGSTGQDEDEFLVTSLEAALEHIDSGVFVPLATSFRTTETSKSSKVGSMFELVANGNAEQVKSILEVDADNFSKLDLCHPLCTCDKCRGVVESNDPTVDSRDDSGKTALHIASMYGKPDVVDYLLSRNADIDAVDSVGRTPLHYAALRGQQSCLLLLLQCCADVNAADNDLNTPLHLSCGFGHVSCVKALIYYCEHEGSKLLINAQNNEGNTPLHNASRWGFLPIVQILIAYLADPSIVNKRLLSSFQVANNTQVTEILTHSRPKFKCCLNVKTINFDFLEEGYEKGRITGEIPLSAKMVKKVEKMLRAVSHGDVNLACFYLGLVPIHTSKQCHPLCLCHHCKKTPLNESSPDKVGINMCNSEGYTALHLAVYHGLHDLTQILIEKGALINVQTRKLVTPLIIAFQQQRIQIAHLLLESKCLVNLQDSKGNSALHYACASNNRRLVEMLLEYRPKLQLKNKSGRTALQEAQSKMSIGIVKLLKDAELQSTSASTSNPSG